MRKWNRIKAALATPFLRRLLGRPSHFVAREELARRYLNGDGVEVGALNLPLRVPEGARVRYVDYRPAEELRNADVQDVRQPDLISDLESMIGIADRSLDFVVANHVLEHVENPLRALCAISRVLRGAGIAFITLPDKRYTFDKKRAVTPLGHILRDFREGPAGSRREHYLDWAAKVERLRGRKIAQRASELERNAANIHFHVWDFPAMRQMIEFAASAIGTNLLIEHVLENRGEVIWILRKGL